jgi:hypothetical protein
MVKYKGEYQIVAAVSSDGDIAYNIENCSPYIFLDKNNNTLFMRFTKLDEQDYNKKFKQINIHADLQEFMRTGISIDYVPMQRWVHIAVVCNSSTFKTTLFAYVDGELVKTLSNGEQFKLIGYEDNYNNDASCTSNNNTNTSVCHVENKSDLNSININMTGYLYVGNIRDYTDGIGPGFHGLLSSFTTYNYELNQQDIYNIYNEGPISGFLAKLGLSSYRLRTPIYKL